METKRCEYCKWWKPRILEQTPFNTLFAFEGQCTLTLWKDGRIQPTSWAWVELGQPPLTTHESFYCKSFTKGSLVEKGERVNETIN